MSTALLPAPLLALAAPNAEMVARSVVSPGNTTRLKRAFAKAARGEPVTLGFIGGSITQGPPRNYASQIAAWWSERFPNASLSVVNAGLAGTGSLLGAFRVGADLLSKDPDLVIVEFSVNDASADADAYEGLLRHILDHRTAPAVLLLFMMWEKGGNLQSMQAPIGRHYDLPMISFRDALWPEIEAGRLAWRDVIVDVVHPNDLGHRYAASFCTNFFEKVLRQRSATHGAFTLDPLPAPLGSSLYEHVGLMPGTDFAPIDRDGWELTPSQIWGQIWAITQSSARFELDCKACGIALIVSGRASTLLERSKITIDGVAVRPMEAPNFLDRDTIVLATGLPNSHHSLRLETADFPSSALGSSGLRALGLFDDPGAD
ncbi:SGNH/GDSL hydrolase family protein [Bradyrhizobium genosp. A]|uniref:SGNH/GDSL hydrolase family protein n=1 Tax=Bradyrhizobium genosp. A TaxID=83626 RepID=UPI003CEE87F3